MTAQPATRPPCGDADLVDRLRAILDPSSTYSRMDAAAGVDSEVVRALRAALAECEEAGRADGVGG